MEFVCYKIRREIIYSEEEDQQEDRTGEEQKGRGGDFRRKYNTHKLNAILSPSLCILIEKRIQN